MKDARIYLLIIGILVAGVAFNSVAQTRNKSGEKKYYARMHHEPKHPKSDFKTKHTMKPMAKAPKHAKQYGRHMRKSHKMKVYATRRDQL